uniref:receptor-like kinase TMK4 n=1 Tax=Erigeron canadensis TaxID=72917 RepID=UPI001CB9A056|nr:receptor-like kinase TMK4 [Erigeron canadensis]
MPHRRHFLFLLYLLFTTVVTADDAAVMSILAKSFSPTPSSWTPTTEYCEWAGITCDNSKRVTAIDLTPQPPSIPHLSGTLPPDIKNLTQLKTLILQDNSLSGPLPDLSDLNLLETLKLDSNNFTSIPQNFFTGLNSLQTFSISDNLDLSPWVIPDDITLATNLQSFYASNSKITGSIPDVFDKLSNLQNLRLSYNNLTGSLPRSFGGSMIQNLWANNQLQGLSGQLDVISSMTQVTQLWLQANSFTGEIPDLSNCTILFDLQLRDNSLTGLVPDSLMSLPKLANVTLQNNKLQGPLPVFKEGVKNELGTDTNSFCLDTPGPCDPQVTTLLEVARNIGYPTLLAEAWKGNDACNHWSYISCDSSGKNVISVSFGNKNFSGTISPAFANLTSLRTLLLNDNSLVGVIPEVLATLPNLVTFDVSNNNLSGKVPVFPPRVKFMNTGNALLGQDVPTGPSGQGAGSGDAGGVSSGSRKGSGSAGMAVGIVIGVVVFVVILLFVLYKCYYVKKRNQKDVKVKDLENGKAIVKASDMGGSSNAHRVSELQSQSSGDHTEMSVFEGGNVNISIDILREVTNNFSDENILGRGGFGIVYKGELHDGTKIAVKRMESGIMGTKGLKEFQAEIAVLTKVRHRHLVALLGYCINGNERLLVYEYMPQGTLSQHLFEGKEHGSSPLSWKQRVSIALDVGRGVEYLHSLAQQSFIHRDLKPSNILLGNDMRAKVADFGLVKNAPDGKHSLETRLAGTFGYLAPEYAATGRVTTKVDVYAFGVVLMELIAGRRALEESMPEDKSHLVTWFRRVLISKENIVKAMDQTLYTDDEETLESICRVAELAGHCTARDPYQRPDMGHAVNVLGPLVQKWEPSRPEEEDGYGIDLHMSLPQVLQRWQADEGTSRMFDDSFGQTHSSIPSKPSGLADTFQSMDAR